MQTVASALTAITFMLAGIAVTALIGVKPKTGWGVTKWTLMIAALLLIGVLVFEWWLGYSMSLLSIVLAFLFIFVPLLLSAFAIRAIIRCIAHFRRRHPMPSNA